MLVVSIALGLLSTLGYGVLADVKLIGMQFLDFFDFVSNSLIMPIVALLTCIFVGYFLKPQKLIDEVEKNGPFKGKRLFIIMIKYIAPVCLVAIFAFSVMEVFGFIKV